jgi:hypothetical protein
MRRIARDGDKRNGTFKALGRKLEAKRSIRCKYVDNIEVNFKIIHWTVDWIYLPRVTVL